MGWRNAAFGWRHMYREFWQNTTFPPHDPVNPNGNYFLFDNRRDLFVVQTGASLHNFDVDQGADSSLWQTPSHFLIPAGHNLADTVTIRVLSGTGSPPTEERYNDTVANSKQSNGWIECMLSLPASRRYWRVELSDAVSFVPELPELIITRQFFPIVPGSGFMTAGPESQWIDTQDSNVIVTPYENGEVGRIIAGRVLKRYQLRYRNVEDDPAQRGRLGTSLWAMREYLNGIAYPLVFWPPYDDEPPAWYRFQNDPVSQNDFPLPRVDDRYLRWQMNLIETVE